MTVRVADDGTIRLMDDCRAEDADLLLQHLLLWQGSASRSIGDPANFCTRPSFWFCWLPDALRPVRHRRSS